MKTRLTFSVSGKDYFCTAIDVASLIACVIGAFRWGENSANVKALRDWFSNHSAGETAEVGGLTVAVLQR